MSSFIYIDSKFRKDPLIHPPTSFTIEADQTDNWSNNPRTINPVNPPIEKQPLDFVSSIMISELNVHYDGLPAEPFVKLDFYNTEFNDSNIVSTMDDLTNIKFIPHLRRDQGNDWYRYSCEVKQVMRIKRKGTFNFTLWDKDNNILNVGPNGRVTCLISITPFHFDWRNFQQARIL